MGSQQGSVSHPYFLEFLTDTFPSSCNPQELFNLHYTSACNVIERIFGVLKWHFWILQLPPGYDMDIQAMISPVLAALHNFICKRDPDKIDKYNNNNDNNNNNELLDL